MVMRSKPGRGATGLKVKEICMIIVIGCCIGVVFNFFWENKVPFIAPSKAEMYAQKNIPTLTLEETRKKFDQGDSMFLDARDAGEYQRKHIKGALSLPARHFELYYLKIKKLLPKHAKIIVYCEGIECGASLYLSNELIRLKHESVEVFLEGWVEWNKAGYPSE